MPRREYPMVDVEKIENQVLSADFLPEGGDTQQRAGDYAPPSSPDRAEQIMQEAGKHAGEMIEQVCSHAANRVREMCKEMSDLAETFKKDGEEFADQIIHIGKFHAERLNRTANHMQMLVKLMNEEKGRLNQLTEIAISEKTS